jgi:DtxR family Mn-dependent transcriptional regulator
MGDEWMRKKTVEEYIEIISSLEREEGEARPGRIATQMGVKPPSITEILQKLEQEGLVFYKPHAAVHLTSSGRTMAQRLEKRHAILSEFLQTIGVSTMRAEKDACQIEHHISDETVKKIEEFVLLCRQEKE